MQTPQTVLAEADSPLAWVCSPKQGTPGVEVRFRLKEGPDKDATINWVGWLSDATIARTQESLALMGYDGERDESVMGNEVRIVIEAEEFDRQDGTKGSRPRVRWVNSLQGAGGFDVMSTAQIAGAKERLKAAALAARKPVEKPVEKKNAAEEPAF